MLASLIWDDMLLVVSGFGKLGGVPVVLNGVLLLSCLVNLVGGLSRLLGLVCLSDWNMVVRHPSSLGG